MVEEDELCEDGRTSEVAELDSDDELEDDKDELEELIATADEDEEDWDEENVSVTEVEDGTETGKLTEGEITTGWTYGSSILSTFSTTGS